MVDGVEIIDKNEVVIFEQIDREKVKSQIYDVRGLRVMLDRDIAAYFGVETGALNRAMKRNIKRFPPEFCFQLTTEECSRCQIGILNSSRGSNIKYLPYAYSEHGRQEKLYHCGASSKDAGCKITTITEIKRFADYKAALKSLLSNKKLTLK